MSVMFGADKARRKGLPRLRRVSVRCPAGTRGMEVCEVWWKGQAARKEKEMTLVSIPAIQTQLAQASTPAESRHVETVSKVAMAYADEQNDYELYMQAWRVYLDARRKTTGLILDGNMDVTDAGFTKMQWSRRLKEYRIPTETLDAYFDSIVASGWQPSINGLLREAAGKEIDRFALAVAEMRRGAMKLVTDFRDRTTDYQRGVLAKLLDAFEVTE